MTNRLFFAKTAAIVSSVGLLSAYVYDRAGGNLFRPWVSVPVAPAASNREHAGIERESPDPHPLATASGSQPQLKNLQTDAPNWIDIIGKSLSGQFVNANDENPSLGRVQSPFKASASDPFDGSPRSDPLFVKPPSTKKTVLPGSKSGILLPAEEFSSPQ
jgi:hypothetical protein